MDKGKRAAFVKKMGKKKLTLKGRQKFEGGGIAGLLGSAGGMGGTGFNAPAGTNAEQINTAYNRNQAALDAQNALAGTLTPQAQTAVNTQNQLVNQYGQQAMGAGPNVAQNMLNQATGQNVAGQAALMAGQRGASANPALMARQIAMQGAATQQQAAGQAATMQAQQQIAAQQAQAQLAANQIAQAQNAQNVATQANQAEQGILQGANTAANNIQGGLAGQTLQGQQGLLGGVMNAAGAVFGLDKGGEVSDGYEVHGPKKLDFLHKIAKMAMDNYHKGEPQKMAEGGMPSANLEVPTVQYQAPQVQFSSVPQVEGGFSVGENKGAESMGNSMKHHESKGSDPMAGASMIGSSGDSDVIGKVMSIAPMLAAEGGDVHPPEFQGPHKSHIANYLMNKGGKVPALVSPGEVYLSPDQVEKVVKEDADPLKIGQKFKGKAKVKGDSKKNDFIPADLEEGGVVVDRENMGSAEKRKLFVHKAIAKKRMKNA